MERTYVFNQDGNNGNGGGSKFDIMAMLPNLMGSKGVDPGLLALLNQGRGSQDQWGGSWWFIWIILLWFCWGGNGFGNRFGNGGGLPAELNGDVGREYLMSAIQGNGNAINQLASSLNCSTQQLHSMSLWHFIFSLVPHAINAPLSTSYISPFCYIKYCIASTGIIIIFFKVYLKIA